MTVDITNLVVANVLVTLCIMFVMYRSSVINNNRLERMFEQVYQENRNTIQYINDTVEKIERQAETNFRDVNQTINEEVDSLYRRLDDMNTDIFRNIDRIDRATEETGSKGNF